MTAWAKLGVKPASALADAVAGRGLDRYLPVGPALRTLLPNGLPRGYTVAVAGGAGRTSLLLAVLAEATRAGSWAALVGLPRVSLAAAGWLGVAVERVALVPEPGPDAAAVVATLVDGVDLVGVVLPGGLSASLYTQLSARARASGSVVVSLTPWPGANLTLSVDEGVWAGRGRLRGRRLTVSVSGRGAAGRPRREQLSIPADPTVQQGVEIAAEVEPRRLRVVA